VEVLSSRVLLHPVDFERSFRFYAESLGLHVYRGWGSGSSPGSSILPRRRLPRALGLFAYDRERETGLWLQVRYVNAVGSQVGDPGVEIIEPPADKPWGLREMQIRDPDGLKLVIAEVPENHPLRRR
jgi:catechol 2,3-dioxygenase-like lactoylglutathione lyase family enzyme